MGCLVIERFAWTVIQLVHDLFNVLVRDVPETAALGKVLPDQTVGVFVQASLPGMVGMRKIYLRIEMFLDGFMSGKLLAVVGGDRQRLIQIRLEQNNRRLRDDFGMFAVDFFDQGELSLDHP